MKRLNTVLMVAVISVAMMLVVAPAAIGACNIDSGHACAYKHVQFDTVLFNSTQGAGSTVDVADNQTSSFKNGTNNWWCGVEAEGWPDWTIFRANPDTLFGALDAADNDKIDHFYVRSPSNGCD